MAKRLYNDRKTLVTDSIEGTILESGGLLARLEYKNTVKVVLRNDPDFKKDKVSLISGGGSGHEPSHAGWVGKGMLTAAVCGDIFASPSTEAVLAAIKAVAGSPGCLVIVKNYTGDRLNFGLAVEKAKEAGYKCDMMIIGDDIAIQGAQQPRGIAGVVFLHKIVGAAAEIGMSLSEVKSLGLSVIKGITTIGMALSVCTIPGATASDRLDGDIVEYGLGLHGEAGVERVAVKSSADTARDLVQRLVAAKKSDGPFALLVNNLGTLPPLEMLIVVRDAVRALEAAGVNVTKMSVMTGVTSLDMAGYSLSLCAITGYEDYLHADTTALSWVPLRDLKYTIPTVPCPEVELTSFSPPKTMTAEGEKVKAVIRAVCTALIAAEAELTEADTQVGDGDCGITLHKGADRVLADVDQYPVDSLSKTLSAIGASAGQSMGGTSGILYFLGLTAAGSGVVSGGDWRDALRKGTEAISHYGGAKEGMRTMLDALFPASRCEGSIADVARAAREGAHSTASMDHADAGRSSYLGADQLRGMADPGATAVGIWLTAIAKELS